MNEPSRTATTGENANASVLPVLLLKTKSTPVDAYEQHFANLEGPFPSGGGYLPHFVPVLEHRFVDISLEWLSKQVGTGAFTRQANNGVAKYGGLIFTSQRAVEAWTVVMQRVKQAGGAWDKLLPSHMPLYVVGPATARGLRALDMGCTITGEETGNGEALARFILGDFNRLYERGTYGDSPKPPLLFLVGEQRRDVIPKMLRSPLLLPRQRIKLEELVVYETATVPCFAEDFKRVIESNFDAGHQIQWIVVFSPTGCEYVLDVLGYLDKRIGKAVDALRKKTSRKKLAMDVRTAFIATIGPTTRDYLIETFGFEPDVCAEQPNEMALASGIMTYMEELVPRKCGQKESIDGTK